MEEKVPADDRRKKAIERHRRQRDDMVMRAKT